VIWACPHAEATATVTIPIDQPRSDFGPWRVDLVRYVNPTGLAEDAADYFELELLVDGEPAASWSTEVGEEGSIAAGTWVDLTLGEVIDRVGQTGERLDLRLTKNGSATLPPGRVQVEGRYL
jgi:hypothetical protein